MPNLKKQLADLRWLLERGRDIITTQRLDAIQDLLQKADAPKIKTMEDFSPEELQAMTEGENAYHPTRPGAPTKTTPKAAKSHQIHSDDKYRNELKTHADEFLTNLYQQMGRDAAATNNPQYAITGHALHGSHPKFGNKFAKDFETAHNEWQQSEDWNQLTPREKHMKMAHFQAKHWDNNPDHVDDFVASGRNHNEYIKAVTSTRGAKVAGEREDIGRGGQGAGSDFTGASARAVAEHTGAIQDKDGRSTINVQESPLTRIARSAPTAAAVFAREHAKAKEMLEHNQSVRADDPLHAERMERFKGIQPHKRDDEEIIQSVADKHQKLREQTQQQKSQEQQGKAPSGLSSAKEQLSKEYLPKIEKIANILIRRAGLEGQVDPQELMPHGQQGLWEAVRDFDPKHHNFRGLAGTRLRARMNDYLREQSGVSRSTLQRVKYIEEAKRNLEAEEKEKAQQQAQEKENK